jgi:hypothetical protein
MSKASAIFLAGVSLATNPAAPAAVKASGDYTGQLVETLRPGVP